jgi:hypothetical protein
MGYIKLKSDWHVMCCLRANLGNSEETKTKQHMIMKKKINYLGAIALAGLLSAVPASAVLISGSVGWTGNYSPVEADGVTPTTLALADGLVFNTPAAMTNTTGDFLTVLGPASSLTPIAIDLNNPFVFDPFVGGPTGFSWGAPAGGPYLSTFTLGSVSVDVQNSTALNLSGMGTLTLDGYSPTPGVFELTANRSGASFTFSGSNAAVPDGGSTIALMGLGLLGFGTGRKFLKR